MLPLLLRLCSSKPRKSLDVSAADRGSDGVATGLSPARNSSVSSVPDVPSSLLLSLDNPASLCVSRPPPEASGPWPGRAPYGPAVRQLTKQFGADASASSITTGDDAADGANAEREAAEAAADAAAAAALLCLAAVAAAEKWVTMELFPRELWIEPLPFTLA
ncbi:hypothetical protein I4F81_007657 [Pyropia yezoensis]|uniref:Uncharacterized protein n=1 Tax=Pyropia yezoensis TaxID=2788 RepID=A0ACC3C5P8_PYRYE|nr:hypothetical protein I4F81_007657 [Neopyropia yezoensis]